MSLMCLNSIIRHPGHLQQASFRRCNLMLYVLIFLSATALVSTASDAALSSDTWHEAASRKSLRESVMRIRMAAVSPNHNDNCV